jgi:hypothetical protein
MQSAVGVPENAFGIGTSFALGPLSQISFSSFHKHNNSDKRFGSTMGSSTHCRRLGIHVINRKVGRMQTLKSSPLQSAHDKHRGAPCSKYFFQATYFTALVMDKASGRKVALTKAVEAVRRGKRVAV